MVLARLKDNDKGTWTWAPAHPVCAALIGSREECPLPVDFATGEGGVQEEANLDVLDRLIRGTPVVDLLTQQSGEKHQMVILHPDQIAVAYNLCDSLGKQAVGLLVCAPILLIERDLTGVVVEQGPENAMKKEAMKGMHTRVSFSPSSGEFRRRE